MSCAFICVSDVIIGVRSSLSDVIIGVRSSLSDALHYGKLHENYSDCRRISNLFLWYRAYIYDSPSIILVLFHPLLYILAHRYVAGTLSSN